MSDRDESPDASAYTGKTWTIRVCPECNGPMSDHADGPDQEAWFCDTEGCSVMWLPDQSGQDSRVADVVEVVPRGALEAAKRERDEIAASSHKFSRETVDNVIRVTTERDEARAALSTTREALRKFADELPQRFNTDDEWWEWRSIARAALPEAEKPNNERSEG